MADVSFLSGLLALRSVGETGKTHFSLESGQRVQIWLFDLGTSQREAALSTRP